MPRCGDKSTNRSSRESPAAEPLLCRTFETPVGRLLAAARADGVYVLEFAPDAGQPVTVTKLAARLRCPIAEGTTPLLRQLERELKAYFAGRLRDFTVPLRLVGTPFQVDVWKQLQRIPHGQTAAYADVARAIGRPRAVRAVGQANHSNPIAIIVPCHRVIARDGGLAGYGGGLWRKEHLLNLERAAR